MTSCAMDSSWAVNSFFMLRLYVLFEQSGLNEERNKKKKTVYNRNGTHYCTHLSSARLLGNYMRLTDHESIHKECWRLSF